MSVLHKEILEQPDALRRALEGSREAVAALVREAKRRDVRYLVLGGRGTTETARSCARCCVVSRCRGGPGRQRGYVCQVSVSDRLRRAGRACGPIRSHAVRRF